jgi:hypothetical protein
MLRLSCSLKLSQGVFLALSPCAGSGHLASCVSSTHVPDIDETVIKFQDCVCQLPTVLLPGNAWLVWLMHVVVVRTVCVGCGVTVKVVEL